jgi:hypothetical protein
MKKESEYNLDRDQSMNLEDLMGSLSETAEFGDLKKKLTNLKQKAIPTPLSDLVKSRLTREV